MKKEIKNLLLKMQSGESDLEETYKNISSIVYSEKEIDFAYLIGIFNVLGIDGLQQEIKRLKQLGKDPHDLIISLRTNN